MASVERHFVNGKVWATVCMYVFDNYTRHFVPFPISTFALCSVHRTSVIKRPTVDYCVILKNARCTERYICPIVSVCIEQCPANRKHYSLCSKTNETVFYHVYGR